MSNPSFGNFYFSTFRNSEFLCLIHLWEIVAYPRSPWKSWRCSGGPFPTSTQSPRPPSSSKPWWTAWQFLQTGNTFIHSFPSERFKILIVRYLIHLLTKCLSSTHYAVDTEGYRICPSPCLQGAHESAWMRPLSSSELPEIQAPGRGHCLVPNSYLLTKCTG